MRRSSAQTREHVLGVVHELFYWQGIRAVGVDRVAAEAGIAPTTLYRLFSSKDDMIGAYVEQADERYREWFLDAVESGGDDPRARILALFDALAAQVRPELCRGCPFLMALAEFPDQTLPAHRNAVTTKRWVHDRLRELADAYAETRADVDPSGLADELFLVMDGVYGSVMALGADGPAARARKLVERLLASD
ncbi:TetR/AcrR family transcriptional regulator [Actinosynnema sp. NPDC091369]